MQFIDFVSTQCTVLFDCNVRFPRLNAKKYLALGQAFFLVFEPQKKNFLHVKTHTSSKCVRKRHFRPSHYILMSVFSPIFYLSIIHHFLPRNIKIDQGVSMIPLSPFFRFAKKYIKGFWLPLNSPLTQGAIFQIC